MRIKNIVLLASAAALIVGAFAVLSSCGKSKTADGRLTIEGFYVAGTNDSRIIVTDFGNRPWEPVVMTEVDDAVIVPAWSELNSGDRIRVTCDLIAETWPAQTNIYTLEKTADGSPADIPADIMSRLAESGHIHRDIDDDAVTAAPEVALEYDIVSELAGLEYRDYTCDGLPEYIITAPGGEVYSVNVSSGWVWLDGTREADLPDELGRWIVEHEDEPFIERSKYYVEEAE